MNVLEVLRVAHREDVISDLLCTCFRESPSFRTQFLSEMPCPDWVDSDRAECYVRRSIAGVGVPDFIITDRSDAGDRCYILVVEHKLKAGEGYAQTERYASDVARSSYASKFACEGAVIDYDFAYLTLFPTTAGSGAFEPVSHNALAQALRSASVEDARLSGLLADWLDLVEAFYACESLDEEREVASQLAAESALDGGYLAFRSFVDSIPWPGALEVTDRFRSSNQGRHYYGAIISKSDWEPEAMDVETAENAFDPFKHFSVHFEPKYDALDATLSVALHYETNPYLPRKKLARFVTPELLIMHDGRKLSLQAQLQESFRGSAGWEGSAKWGGGKLQVVRAPIDFTRLTVREARQEVVRFVEQVAPVVDHWITSGA